MSPPQALRQALAGAQLREALLLPHLRLPPCLCHQALAALRRQLLPAAWQHYQRQQLLLGCAWLQQALHLRLC